MRTPWQLLNHINIIYLYTAAFEDGHINSQPEWLYTASAIDLFLVSLN